MEELITFKEDCDLTCKLKWKNINEGVHNRWIPKLSTGRNSYILSVVYSLLPHVPGRKCFIPVPTLGHENLTVEDTLV